jgi:hypothetical protein
VVPHQDGRASLIVTAFVLMIIMSGLCGCSIPLDDIDAIRIGAVSPSTQPLPTGRRLKEKKLSCGSALQGPPEYTRLSAHDISRPSRRAARAPTGVSSRC